MPNPNYTDISLLIDRSGSMASIAQDVVGGTRAFIAEQRKLEGTCLMTIVQFDSCDPQEVICRARDIREANYGILVPRGATPLLDALGTLIENTGTRLAKMKDAERPGKVVIMVYTDGLENASSCYSKARVRELINHQQTKYGWQFIFMGSDFDVFGEGQGLGFSAQSIGAVGKNSLGTETVFMCAAAATSGYRSGKRQTASYTMAEQDLMRSTVDVGNSKIDLVSGDPVTFSTTTPPAAA